MHISPFPAILAAALPRFIVSHPVCAVALALAWLLQLPCQGCGNVHTTHYCIVLEVGDTATLSLAILRQVMQCCL